MEAPQSAARKIWLSIGRDPRNLIVVDSEGQTVAGLYQQGSIRNQDLYHYLRDIILSPSTPAFVLLLENDAVLAEDTTRLAPGCYKLTSAVVDRSLSYTLSTDAARNRLISRPAQDAAYRARTRERDSKCLITGVPVINKNYSAHQCSHLFPRSSEAEFVAAGFDRLITDDVALAQLGGVSKIDSIQNVILLRSDVHGCWDDYSIGVNPDNNYLVSSFTQGSSYLDGLRLNLSHITDSRIRPLDELLREHARNGVLRWVRGGGQRREEKWDSQEAFSDGVSLQDAIWGSEHGKEAFESALANRFVGWT